MNTLRKNFVSKLIQKCWKKSTSKTTTVELQLNEVRRSFYQTNIKNGNGTDKSWITWRGILFKWTPLSVCTIVTVQWFLEKEKSKRESSQALATQWQSDFYCSLPLRLFSRSWGWMANCRIPIPIRPLVYGTYSAAFGVNLDEAASSDFKSYRSLCDFFTRSLKENVRVIDANSCLVSPADGRVLHFGSATCEQIEQVKGITYSLKSFLGPANWATQNSTQYVENIKLKSHQYTSLYQCVIYLAPGDYHRFHSPAQWIPLLRRHFSGELLSVNPQIANWLPELFCLNERVLYIGQWEYGFFSFAAVGATNVGSVQVYMDEQLKTNKWKGFQLGKQTKSDQFDEILLPPDTILCKGEILGQFNMGSTIVLIFEAPNDFKFNIQQGQRIKMGECLGSISSKKEQMLPVSL